MDYQFIADSNLVGQEFYNPQEYNERGIIYTIIDMDDSGLDLEWEDPEEGVEYASMTLRELINGLNDNFYVLKSDDPNMSFLDQIW
jgi:hypothetical protein